MLKRLFQRAKDDKQGVMVITIPSGAIRKIYCPYCGQPFTKEPEHIEGHGVMDKTCRNHWCGTRTDTGKPVQTVVWFRTREGTET